MTPEPSVSGPEGALKNVCWKEITETVVKRVGFAPSARTVIKARLTSVLHDVMDRILIRLIEQTTTDVTARLERDFASRRPERQRLPSTRNGMTRRFQLARPPRNNVCPKCRHAWEENANQKIYVHVGCYPDGRPGEVFLRADKVGTTANGALDAAALAISIGLQYGVPLGVYVEKLRHTRYGAGGFTGDEEFPQASSVLDLVAQWLGARFVLPRPEL